MTILRKRENFRAAFAGFSIPAVAPGSHTHAVPGTSGKGNRSAPVTVPP
ncbi:hypothetical protein AB0395_27135 [Streptosporangium sp. NPDC051023]